MAQLVGKLGHFPGGESKGVVTADQAHGFLTLIEGQFADEKTRRTAQCKLLNGIVTKNGVQQEENMTAK